MVLFFVVDLFSETMGIFPDNSLNLIAMKTTIKTAKDNTIFYINEDLEVESTTELEFIMRSVDETTSPMGVMPRLHIRENNDENTFEVWTWGTSGNNAKFIKSFEIKEEADEFIFQKTYEYDFMEDDQRDTQYFFNEEEAQALADERKSYL